MPLPLSDLDTRRYDDLVAELQALIPQWAPVWTNHNASDPGITLLELLAWLTEASLYRLNKTPEATYWNLIRLLRPEDSDESPRWSELTKLPLAVAKVQATQWYNERYRAVTARDFEELVMERKFPQELMAIARVKANGSFDKGIVSVVIVPQENPFLVNPMNEVFEATKKAVKKFLDMRRLVGTRVRVRGPIYTEVNMEVEVQAVADVDAQETATDIRQRIITEINTYLDPITGGPDATGWPFGRPVSSHDIMPLVESVREVGRVIRLVLDRDPERLECPIADLPKIGDLDVTVTDASPG